MCKSCAEGGVRCQSDTSEARRLRRKASNALEAHTGVVGTKTEPVTPYPSSSIQKLKELAGELHEQLHQLPLANQIEQDHLDDALEVQVTALGRAIAIEAEARVGFSSQNFAPEELSSDEKEELRQKLVKSYHQVLGEMRVLGGEISVDSNTDPVLVENINRTVGKYYPSSWIEASNAVNDRIRTLVSETRAHYVHQKFTGELPEDQPADTHLRITTRYGLIPVSGLSHLKETLGDEAKILPGRTVEIDNITYQPIEVANTWKEETRSDETGWRYGHYLQENGHISQKKSWLKDYEEKPVVIRPEVLLPAGISTIKNKATYYHEFGHRMEAVLGEGVLMRQQEAFLRRRTTDPVTGKREVLTPIYVGQETGNPFSTELGRKDSFISHYVGKEYAASGHREVFTVGVEAVFAGTQGTLNGLDAGIPADHDHKGFILGVLATI